jgi:hypothetical protein
VTAVAVWLCIGAPVGWLLGRLVVRVHREITASQEATERGLRAEAERRRREAQR